MTFAPERAIGDSWSTPASSVVATLLTNKLPFKSPFLVAGFRYLFISVERVSKPPPTRLNE
jgi:hypothetical protein